MGIEVTVAKDRIQVSSQETGTPGGPTSDNLVLWVGATASNKLSYVEVEGAVHKITNALRAISTPLPTGLNVTQGGVEFGAQRDHLFNVGVAVDAVWSANESTVDVAYGATFLNSNGQSITSAVHKALDHYRDTYAKKKVA